jgi:hypothetical protein
VSETIKCPLCHRPATQPAWGKITLQGGIYDGYACPACGEYLIERYTIETYIADWWKRGQKDKLVCLSAFTRRRYERRRPRNLAQKKLPPAEITPILVANREEQRDPTRPGLVALPEILDSEGGSIDDRLRRTAVTLGDMTTRLGRWVALHEQDCYIADALDLNEFEVILTELKKRSWIDYQHFVQVISQPDSLLNTLLPTNATKQVNDQKAFCKVRLTLAGWQVVEQDQSKPGQL